MSSTNDFGDKPIGKGGFGKVYKGRVSLAEGHSMVAFKRLDRLYGQGDTEFWKEVMMLSDYKHENLISLQYFCNDNAERILVYEYASRGSLDRYLGDASLTWIKRLKICLGAARGVYYLHNPMKPFHSVIHRDIKSSNILLEESWTAKVSDFGLSKIGPANDPHSYLVSNVVGTHGYCDPVYMETGVLSKESDVYSFGVVLFEVMCGRLCVEYHDDDNYTHILVRMWKHEYDEKRLDEHTFLDVPLLIHDKDSAATPSGTTRFVKLDTRHTQVTEPELIRRHPKLRRDGWMEVYLWEVVSDTTRTIKRRIRLTSFTNKLMNFDGLVVQGMEFRHL
nr:dual specificity protein kinase zak2-like [Tanacetum cinerariifolium]